PEALADRRLDGPGQAAHAGGEVGRRRGGAARACLEPANEHRQLGLSATQLARGVALAALEVLQEGLLARPRHGRLLVALLALEAQARELGQARAERAPGRRELAPLLLEALDLVRLALAQRRQPVEVA